MDALTVERFGPGVPRHELGTRPTPVVVPKPSGPDTPKALAERRRELVLALDPSLRLRRGLP